MGSVTPYDTAKGRRYRARWWTPERTQAEKGGFRSKRDAELHIAAVEVAKARGEYLSATAAKATVADLAPEWLANKQQAMKPSAYAPVEDAWRIYVEPRWGSASVGQIRPSAVE